MKLLPILFFTLLSIFCFAQDEPFELVEQMPVFKISDDPKASFLEQKKYAEQQLLEFIYMHIRYPEQARQFGIEGTVVIRFVVDTDGSVTNPQIIIAIGGGCEEEALRVVKLLPNFERPGMHEGVPVKVQFNLPVRFKLTDDPVPPKQKAKSIRQKSFRELRIEAWSKF